MSDISEVIRLLEEWRDASGVGRLKVGIDAARTIGGMPAEAKRALAIEVASRVAPQLVPAIESESGDLTSEQIGAVVDLLRRADEHQLDELITAIRTGNVSDALTLVDDALDAVGPTAAPLAAAATGTSVGRRVAAAEEELDQRLDALIDDTVDALEASDDAETVEELESEAERLAQLDLEAERARIEAEARAKADRWKDTSRHVSDEPAYRAPEISFSLDLGEVEMPDPTVEEVAPLEQRRDDLPGARVSPDASVTEATTTRVAAGRALTSGRARPRRAAVGRVGAPELTDVLAAPDGYRRRRAAVSAVQAGTLDRSELVRVVGSLASASDRAWVAGAALDTGLIGADDLADLDLSEHATRRLTRRVG